MARFPPAAYRREPFIVSRPPRPGEELLPMVVIIYAQTVERVCLMSNIRGARRSPDYNRATAIKFAKQRQHGPIIESGAVSLYNPAIKSGVAPRCSKAWQSSAAISPRKSCASPASSRPS